MHKCNFDYVRLCFVADDTADTVVNKQLAPLQAVLKPLHEAAALDAFGLHVCVLLLCDIIVPIA